MERFGLVIDSAFILLYILRQVWADKEFKLRTTGQRR